MAKQQRSTQLPGEMLRVTDAFEARTGARFNRTVLAALIRYFFVDPRGPDPACMQAAVAVENGTMSLDDVPDWIAGQHSAARILQCLDLRQRNPKDSQLRYLQHDINEADRDGRAWHNIRQFGEDVVDGLLRFWAVRDMGFDQDMVLKADDLDALGRLAAEHIRMSAAVRQTAAPQDEQS